MEINNENSILHKRRLPTKRNFFMNNKVANNKFVCSRCNKEFSHSERAEKDTRDDKPLCKKCLVEYEISWDEFEDWLKNDRNFCSKGDK